MEQINNCTLCNGAELTTLYKGIDKYFSNKEVNFCICKKCNLVFLNPRPTASEYDEMYKTVFQDQRRSLQTIEEAIQRLKNKDSYNKKNQHLQYFKPYLDPTSHCLEIGSGWGTMARVIKDNIGCEVEAVEPSHLAAKTAQEYYGLKVYNDTFDSFYEKYQDTKKFDFIYLFHVFEHLLEPDSFAVKIKQLLQPNGKILIAVPDLTNPDQPNEKFFHMEHAFYYTPKTLSLLLSKNGFRIDNIFKDQVDFKIVCSLSDEAISVEYNNNEYLKIKKAIFLYNLKFTLLKIIKKPLYLFLDNERRKNISFRAARLLKKMRVIKN